ncbi:hypothetical protein [Pseudomonas syringae]|uniref:hypothetical protein n=1 Tax=Pseudomonas syringae TaxID=317 RepID=UPI000709EA3B|nr:hypothetical protein [Pseudomonas syringae]KWS45741.1 hypothetical protein AL060_12305 [Pseudomonas syringae pv. rhaphiolepidis]
MACPRWFVDFEASGIALDSYPIEIAVVSADIQYQALIQPARNWTHWSWDAQDMHGISREPLLADGLAPRLVADELNARFEGMTLCSDSPQDGFWLDTLSEAAEVEPSFILLPLESFVGRAVASQILNSVPPWRAHRALEDALALRRSTLAFRGR